MSIETIDWNIENENNRHKNVTDNLERNSRFEKDKHEKIINSLKQQKKNIQNQNKNKHKHKHKQNEQINDISISELNQKIEKLLSMILG